MAEICVETPDGSVVVKMDAAAFSRGADVLKAARQAAELRARPRLLAGSYGVKREGDTIAVTFPLAPE